MPYRYRLEPVLKYRRDLEEMAQQKLGRQQFILDEQQKKLNGLRTERQEMMADFERRKGEPMPAPLFASYTESLTYKESDIETQIRVVKTQEQAVAKARDELAEKVKGRKVLEKARERDLKKYIQEELRKEQKDNDEMMVLRHGRKSRFTA